MYFQRCQHTAGGAAGQIAFLTHIRSILGSTAPQQYDDIPLGICRLFVGIFQAAYQHAPKPVCTGYIKNKSYYSQNHSWLFHGFVPQIHRQHSHDHNKNARWQNKTAGKFQ